LRGCLLEFEPRLNELCRIRGIDIEVLTGQRPGYRRHLGADIAEVLVEILGLFRGIGELPPCALEREPATEQPYDARGLRTKRAGARCRSRCCRSGGWWCWRCALSGLAGSGRMQARRIGAQLRH